MTQTQSLIAARESIERDREEQRILAESALVGERAVSILRIVMWVLLGIAFSGVEAPGHKAEEANPLHIGAIGGWLLFAIVVAVVLRRVTFTPRRAMAWPIVFMLVDFGVLIALESTSIDAPRPEVTMGIFAILIAFSVARFRTVHVVLSALFGLGGYVSAMAIHHLLDWRSCVVVAAAYACLGGVMWWANRRVRRMFVDVRRGENLARLMPRQVAARILASGGVALKPVQREVTILFSDLRDFTSMSQKMDPGGVLALLDEYFSEMSQIVKGHDGMVNKFIGDGMLAVWGVPDALPNHAELAVRAALDMRKAIEALNSQHAKDGRPILRIGVGIHTGEVAAGMLGGPDQHEYTVIGDAVNLASRIEGLTKKAGTDILVSEATWQRCEGKFAGESVGAEQVKGRDEAVTVYRVKGSARGENTEAVRAASA
ncbi:MAG: adenylate/guanylate cyclase domain-containing protein [Myxococcaceae bacterium]